MIRPTVNSTTNSILYTVSLSNDRLTVDIWPLEFTERCHLINGMQYDQYVSI